MSSQNNCSNTAQSGVEKNSGMMCYKKRSFLLLVLMVLFTQVVGESFFSHHEDLFVKFKRDVAENIFNLTSQCLQTYNNMNFITFLQLLDASAKLGNGISRGNAYDLGDFDGCYKLDVNIQDKSVKGKYCMGISDFNPFSSSMFTNISLAPRSIFGEASKGLTIHYAYCTFSSCTSQDIENIINTLLPIGWKFDESTCYSSETKQQLTTGAVITIVVLAVITAFVIVSTLYETILYYKDKKVAHELFIAFSLINNGKKLFSTSKNREQLLCLNGLRSITMLWVVFGHEMILTRMGAISNYVDVNNFLTNPKNMFLTGSTVAVDTFFSLGGLLTMYSFLKSKDQRIKFIVFSYYLHRYLRLTPLYGVIVLIHANLLTYMSNGPMWNAVKTSLEKPCQDNWWASLLYIQNYVRYIRDDDSVQTCVPQTWYLSIDFQLFLLSPIVLYVVAKWEKAGWILMELLICIGMVIPALITYNKNLSGQMVSFSKGANLDDYTALFYEATYSRFAPYVIGMLFGTIIYNFRKEGLESKKTRNNILVAFCLWIIALTGLVACVYAGHGLVTDDYNAISAAFFNGLNRPAWALSVCIIVFLCISGFGGPINTFLSLPIFQFFTKLCYVLYLVHFSLIAMRWSATRTPVHFDLYNATIYFWGDFMYSLILGIVFTLFFESPVIILEKYIIGRETNKSNIHKHNV